MMQPCRLQTVYIKEQAIPLFIPDEAAEVPSSYSPYWAKVWPAAAGLCYYLSDNLYHVQHKTVLELAAGLGLPSLFAARHAAAVLASDIEPAAVELIKQSASHSGLKNISTAIIDWRHIDDITIPDTVLLSDINYEPAEFEYLFRLINELLEKDCTIVLSTPQRLMAKPFISQLLPWCREQTEVPVDINDTIIPISVFVLRK